MPIFHEEAYPGPVRWETNSYKKEWSWSKKVDFYFDQLEKMASAKSIVEFILDNEQSLERSKARSSVSAALSNGLKNRQLLKFTDPISNTFYYGKPAWFDEKMNPKVERIPEKLKAEITK